MSEPIYVYRRIFVTCPRCGWAAQSATQAGARLLADAHTERAGLAHITVIQVKGARPAMGR